LLLRVPSVSIVDVQIASVGLTGATAAVRLRVENPNPLPLTSGGLTYQLDLRNGGADDDPAGWKNLASGESTQIVRVPRGDTVEVTVSVPFDYADLGFALETLLATGKLRYRLSGDVRFDVPLGEVSVPFEETGNLGF
jgi:LEA14-like dessication related protein